MKDASQQGKGKGDTFHWNVYSDVATQGTTLTETNTMPETQFVITQGTLTITELIKKTMLSINYSICGKLFRAVHA